MFSYSSADLSDEIIEYFSKYQPGHLASIVPGGFYFYLFLLICALIPLDTAVNAKPRRKGGVSGSQGAVTPTEGGPSSKTALSAAEQLSPSGRQLTPAEIKRKELKKLIEEMNEEGDGRAPMVKLGDASMAAPFTAKHSSVRPTTDIIRQGRSTLVTTLQMFKILGLNCLATAYVLSVMYLDGVKLGDMQVRECISLLAY